MILVKTFGNTNSYDPRDTDNKWLMDACQDIVLYIFIIATKTFIDTTNHLYKHWKKWIQQNKMCDVLWSLLQSDFLSLKRVHSFATLKSWHIVWFLQHSICWPMRILGATLLAMATYCSCSQGYMGNSWQHKWCTYLWILQIKF